MNKVLMSLVFGTFICTANSFAQTPAATTPAATAAAPAASAPVSKPTSKSGHQHHGDIHKVVRKLRAAKDELQKLSHEYGGHKAKAIEAIDKALVELHDALEAEKGDTK